jgi:hypothetical protein
VAVRAVVVTRRRNLIGCRLPLSLFYTTTVNRLEITPDKVKKKQDVGERIA